MSVLDVFAATSRISDPRRNLSSTGGSNVRALLEFDWEAEARTAGCLECVEKPIDFGVLDRVLGQDARS